MSSFQPGRRKAPRPNAASDTYARTSASSSKFDLRNPSALAATEDEDYDAETAAVLSLDEIGASSRGVKRNAVNLDGYDSDSDNEGFKVDDTTSPKKKKKPPVDQAEDSDEDDMFGGDESQGEDATEEAVVSMRGEKKKDVRFLDLDEIEGQDFASKREFQDVVDEGSGSDSEEEEVDEEVGAGGKKKHAPKMDGFNMKAEMEEGRFDDQGNFVRKAADGDAQHDAWLQGVSRKDMKRAKESQEKRDAEARQKMLEDDAVLTGDVIAALLMCLERGETVLEALGRLNKGKPKPKKSWQKKRAAKKDGEMEVDEEKEPEDPKETARKEHIEKITAAADRLLSRGNNDIYQESREYLTRMYKKETGEEWVEPTKVDDVDEALEVAGEVDQWEYKWTGDREDGQVYGPYGGAEMKAWDAGGFFGEDIMFRRYGEGEHDWSRIPEFR